MKSFTIKTIQEEYSMTRGVHADILIFRNDIGGHNGLDKFIGEALATGSGFPEKILLTSGGISSEILSKVLRCRMPVLATVGASTNKLAR